VLGENCVVSIKDFIFDQLNEAKAAVKEYFHCTTVAVKKRIKKILILTISGMILLSIAIALLGLSALFLLIGNYKYLSQFMPAWAALDLMGLIAAIIAVVFLAALYLIIRKQLKTDEPKT
jgi:hypothetical protein